MSQSKRVKRSKWRAKHYIERNHRHNRVHKVIRNQMSKTHQQQLRNHGKKISVWLIRRLEANGPVPSVEDIVDYVNAAYQAPNYSTEDQIGIGRVAMAIVSRDRRDLWPKLVERNPNVEDRNGG